MNNLLSDRDTYEEMTNDPTDKIKSRVNKFLDDLLKREKITNAEKR